MFFFNSIYLLYLVQFSHNMSHILCEHLHTFLKIDFYYYRQLYLYTKAWFVTLHEGITNSFGINNLTVIDNTKMTEYILN